MESKYFKKLLEEHPDIGERYRMKLNIVNGLDPFTLDVNNLDYSIDAIPPITYMDIQAYLVYTASSYTKEQLRAFKSLQAYKYFESGFVLKLGTKITNGVFVLVGQVKHSQKTTLKPANVLCIVQKDGSISAAHCTCMAGCGEVCSHVGAVLFATECANKKKEPISCTDSKAVWTMPSMSSKVPLVPVSEMNFGRSCITKENKRDVPALSATEICNLLSIYKDLDLETPLMYVIEPFASEIEKKKSSMVASKLHIFNETFTTKSYSELMKISKDIDFSLTMEQVTAIEKASKDQSQNQNWYAQRAGRITASKFKQVCKTNKNEPSLSLLKAICYPTKMLFSTKATNWGLTHEHVAVQTYQKYMEEEKTHESFVINDVGLLISAKWPQIAASPDRLVFCECCLGGCLEVKCPYLLKTNNIVDINEYLEMKSTCLYKNNGQICLKIDHAYYYQVQMQIFASNLQYCDFVVWSPNIFFKQRIYPNWDFWLKNVEIALKYHSEVVMPELLGKFFTKAMGAAEVMHYCICNGVDDGRPMIECDHDECETKWFHFDCVNLKNVPDLSWYCNQCSVNFLK